MKRKLIVLFTAVMLIAGNAMANTYAYSTLTSEDLGSYYNNSSRARQAYGKLYPDGGVARLRIRKTDGSVVASGVYPVYPQNIHYTVADCPKYNTRKFDVISEDGNQIWGSQTVGLRDY